MVAAGRHCEGRGGGGGDAEREEEGEETPGGVGGEEEDGGGERHISAGHAGAGRGWKEGGRWGKWRRRARRGFGGGRTCGRVGWVDRPPFCGFWVGVWTLEWTWPPPKGVGSRTRRGELIEAEHASCGTGHGRERCELNRKKEQTKSP